MRRFSLRLPAYTRPLSPGPALALALVLGVVSTASAQRLEPVRDAPTGVFKFDADPADVATIDAIITASYDVISGPAGDRDWDRERSLFHPDSRHMPTHPNAHGGSDVDVTDVESFIQKSSAFFATTPFYEYEIARTTQRFGDIAHVFSTYAWGRTKDGPVGGRGINSFQLLFDGERWWIVSVYWAQESADTPIPPEYLPAGE